MKLDLDLKDFKDMERHAVEQLHQQKVADAVARVLLDFAIDNIHRLGGKSIDEEILEADGGDSE